MKDQASTEIWRDEKTGLPMHSHAEYVPMSTPDGGLLFQYADSPHKPCNCGDSLFDILLSVAPKPKGETNHA